MGDIKSVGLYSGRWTPRSDSDLGDPGGSGGSGWDSSEWIRKVDLKLTPLSRISTTLGDRWVYSGLDGMLILRSNCNISSERLK